MRRQSRPRRGDGTAWLVADRSRGDYLCYWYVGIGDSHLVEHARAPSAEDAIGWGRQRTHRVRITTAEARTYWAGATPAPYGFAFTWPDADIALTVEPAPADRRPATASGPAPGQDLPHHDDREMVGAGHGSPRVAPC